MSALEHIGLTWRIAPGRAADYDRDHAEVWPRLEQRMHELGAEQFSIFRRGDLVFAHLAGRDYAGFVEAYASDPIAVEWEAQWDDILIVDHPDAATGWPERLVHVWTMR
jgi:L-rhamnose mutarotase